MRFNRCTTWTADKDKTTVSLKKRHNHRLAWKYAQKVYGRQCSSNRKNIVIIVLNSRVASSFFTSLHKAVKRLSLVLNGVCKQLAHSRPGSHVVVDNYNYEYNNNFDILLIKKWNLN